ncbi:hypothetical protein [Polymorphobacter sp.]|uniref:hypothetical protein n=1 Tax=Polymorphobacter sp. TaxID=1909290 RepID=UPI003F72D66D
MDLHTLLLTLHIVVLGYWLGSELVINSNYRFVTMATSMPHADRIRLMGHVLNVDQHVRYALILQASLGTALAASLGYIPGGAILLWSALAVGALWLAFVEYIHHHRHNTTLACIDRGSRYLLIALLLAFGIGLLAPDWPLPFWLRLKLALFAGVMLCGVGIRLALKAAAPLWTAMAHTEPDAATNAALVGSYWRATAILLLLWMFILAITWLSIAKL